MKTIANPNGPSALSQWDLDHNIHYDRELDIQPPDDPINHPPWYKGSGGIEVCEVIEQFSLPYHLGEVVAHILRAGRKPGVSRRLDLEEALWHLRREIGLLP